MTSLLWPGDDLAGDLMSDAAIVAAMVRVESAWLTALVEAGIAPPGSAVELADLVSTEDIPQIAVESDLGGNPVIPFLSLLRKRLPARSNAAATWLHRGLTSQDVLDTALQLAAADVLRRLEELISRQVQALAALADAHRTAVMTGRTLTQPAVPITFGLKAAVWLRSVLDAGDEVRAAAEGLAVQLGGAAGTLAATTWLAEQAALPDPAGSVSRMTAHVAEELRLMATSPWHTSRRHVTRLGDTLVSCTDAWGHIAADVLTLSRPEIGELAEGNEPGRGGSSTMPQKANPVRAILIRRAALAGPALAAQLHLAAADASDERSAGAWHLEWETLQTLARRTVVAAVHTTALLDRLQVNADRMRAGAQAFAADLLAEAQALPNGRVGAAEVSLTSYGGLTDDLIDAELARAATFGEVRR